MIEEFYIEDFESFIKWYGGLNIEEAIDMNEAMTIYFNQETYNLGVI